MKALCFATNNNNKTEEIRALLGSFFLLKNLKDIGCAEELPETQPTIEGNAHQKAQYVFDNYGIACFADDTGLEVEALNGEPGVYSARYAGSQRNDRDNMSLLLSRLEKSNNRKARFKTVISWVENGRTENFEGLVYGTIIDSPRGSNGFGYDPVFVPDGFDKTFAEMELAEKNLISHRAIAVKKLINFLRGKYA
ncbi:MAG TPA: RdgB/HAM1 family non-canonical purine NTP pyrophosphatase [Cyclobacteriaceae bacterium]|nr:RdgB/HAM1 family non-canonical purine NTP pyrophosphatase [Cyclobacteriaceae bacterium]HMV10089.1 RdgB/HAM1 family non-canonical purine NTP pyrophosphatase [Cyclobacteriaceae bacterium]HMV88642.1 RdgB/HAM1 family non-canonical purine NTP pyrophosphatase [Cyclobacteriaceae bacterium]HMX00596.1 RdgB/HAM1 family non-canonical purine NTP pyrophosphatase [Cyclobacteriaceae bacterium]HMX49529.1 RdgB/HAM1 family non-canonical purine NTP pyrophosphatase [Cyclobacteriaceae bacterium]